MAYEMKPGQGSAFPNDKKTPDKPASPDFKGRVMLPNGETRWLSVWNKKTAAGQDWISFSIGELVQSQGAPVYSAAHQTFVRTPSPSAPSRLDDPDGDIPF